MIFGIACAGLKGLEFFSGLLEANRAPRLVCSYSQAKDQSNAFEGIKALAHENGIKFINAARPSFPAGLRVFVVGWQYLFDGSGENTVVFHDSLLPKHRGFAPTVSALLANDPRLGVTAFKPDKGVDTGPVYSQAGFEKPDRMKIGEALKRQSELMVGLALKIIDADAAGRPIMPKPQDENGASYSIWRGDDDYWIDFSSSADQVARQVDALGYPYEGARTSAEGKRLKVGEAEIVEDLNFVERHPGKVWRLDDGDPVVVCGQGLVKLSSITTEDGAAWKPKRLRLRFAGALERGAGRDSKDN